MKLASMAISTAEKVEMGRPMTSDIPADKLPDYPHGLQLFISYEDMQKLSLANEGLQGGQRVTGQFTGIVTSMSGDLQNTILKRRATVQITDLALEVTAGEDKADVLYPGSNT